MGIGRICHKKKLGDAGAPPLGRLGGPGLSSAFRNLGFSFFKLKISKSPNYGCFRFLKTLNLNQSRNFSGCASDKSLS